jgi:acetolactate synthase-1/2/3 large subunit
MLGASASRPRLAKALSDFVRRLQIPFFCTQMGKGAAAGGSGLYMGTAALSARDYVHDAIERADLIISIGHDTVEKPPFLMGPGGPKVLHVGYLPATVEEVYFPHAELIGDVGPSLELLADRLEGRLPRAGALLPLPRQQTVSRVVGIDVNLGTTALTAKTMKQRRYGFPCLDDDTRNETPGAMSTISRKQVL